MGFVLFICTARVRRVIGADARRLLQEGRRGQQQVRWCRRKPNPDIAMSVVLRVLHESGRPRRRWSARTSAKCLRPPRFAMVAASRCWSADRFGRACASGGSAPAARRRAASRRPVHVAHPVRSDAVPSEGKRGRNLRWGVLSPPRGKRQGRAFMAASALHRLLVPERQMSFEQQPIAAGERPSGHGACLATKFRMTTSSRSGGWADDHAARDVELPAPSGPRPHDGGGADLVAAVRPRCDPGGPEFRTTASSLRPSTDIQHRHRPTGMPRGESISTALPSTAIGRAS